MGYGLIDLQRYGRVEIRWKNDGNTNEKQLKYDGILLKYN
jgi:hypothetical protein